jgi:hypothetical protein
MRKGPGSGRYPWLFVTQIVHNGQTFEVITSTYPSSVASLSAATFYQGNPDRNHKLWNWLRLPVPLGGDP